MNGHDLIDSTLKDVLDVIKPSREHWVTRFSVINEIQDVILSLESLRGATAEPFGSFVSNLFSRWGDLDISIELPNGAFISSSGKKRKLNLLAEVLVALRQKGSWRKLKFFSNARVPILKFESIHHRISCDLSVDNLLAQIKSKFLFWISEIDGRFRDMVLLVKEWAQANNINNPKSGTFNSYSLCLLVLFHFQTCVPAILPPLRVLYPRNVADDLNGVRADAEKDIAETCAANIARFRSDKPREVNRSSLCELFISFLAKFSDIEARAQELGISTFTGKWDEIRNNTQWLPKTYAIFIEDPFEQAQNTGRAVSLRQMGNITDAFRRTRHSLVSIHQNKSTILTTLVRPQVFQSIVRQPMHVMYPNHNNGRNIFAPPPFQRTNHLSGQVRHKPQKTKQGNRSQSLTTPRKMPKNSEGPQTSTQTLEQKDHSQQKKPTQWRPKPGTKGLI